MSYLSIRLLPLSKALRYFLFDLWLLVSEDLILWIVDLRNIGINSLISSVFHLLDMHSLQ